MKANQLATITAEIDCIAAMLKGIVSASPSVKGFGDGAVVVRGEAVIDYAKRLHDLSANLREMLEGISISVEEAE